MNIADWAVLITAIGGLIAGGGGLLVGIRGQNRTEDASRLAALLEGYDEIVANLRDEVKRLKDDFTSAHFKLSECEARCQECTEALLTLKYTTKKLEERLHHYENQLNLQGSLNKSKDAGG